jgi:hypothetical protein
MMTVKMSKSALYQKNKRYIKEKRLAELYSPLDNQQIQVKHFILSLNKNALFFKKFFKKPRLIFDFLSLRRQFLFFKKRSKISAVLQFQVKHLRKKETSIEVVFHRDVLLKRLFLAKYNLFKKYNGVVLKIKNQNHVFCSLIFRQFFLNREWVTHRVYPYAPHVVYLKSERAWFKEFVRFQKALI